MTFGRTAPAVRCSGVTLEVEERANCIRLTLTDNGIGARSLDAGAGHFGIATMRARADAEGGVLGIESSPGHGTVVALVLPTGGRGKPGRRSGTPARQPRA